MTLKEDTKKEVHFVMNLFFYFLSKNNLYSGLKGLKDLKFKRFKEFPARFYRAIRVIREFRVFIAFGDYVVSHRNHRKHRNFGTSKDPKNTKRPMPFGTSLIFVV